MTRARGTGLILVTVLFASTVLAPIAFASGDQASYRDQFNTVSYSGNDGSLAWANPWSEIGDDNKPSQGVVQVVEDQYCAAGRCLRAGGGLLALDTVGAARYADTSIFSDANLSYHLRSRSLGLLLAPLGGVVKVQVTTNPGGSWTTVDSLAVVDLGQATTREVPINGFLSKGFGVRFLVEGLLGGEMFVDDVEIEGTLTPTTTTTSTTTTSPQPTTTNPATTSTSPTTSTSTTLHTGGGDHESSPPRNGTGTATTSTTTPTSTTTSPRTTETAENMVVVTSDDAGLPPGTGGLRYAQHGIQASYDRGMVGDGDMVRPEVLGLTFDYRMAVEVISSAWMGLVGLTLLITAALVTGHDRRTPGDPRRSRSIRP